MTNTRYAISAKFGGMYFCMNGGAVISSILLFAFCSIVAKAQVPVSPEAGRIADPIICQTNAAQSYAVYIPAKGNRDALPAIYFFDPHGNGALPLAKYKNLADEYGFILIGSNNSKNGNDWATTETIWQQIFNDSQKRLKLNNNRIYACGFSGGAKVAGYVAIKYPAIKGIVVNGAGLPDGTPANNFNFSITAIAGGGDMNMAGLVTLSEALDNTATRHRIIIFDGKHEWAPAATMRLAFAGFQLDAMLQGTLVKDETYISSFTTQSKQRFNTLFRSNQLIKAMEECSYAVSLLTGLTNDLTWFKQRIAVLSNNDRFKKQQQQQVAIQLMEQTRQQEFERHFDDGGMNYWTETIPRVQALAIQKTERGMMYQRLVAWLSLAFYSISNQMLSSNQNEAARHFVALYKLDDPTNSEAWYFSAIVNARSRQAQAAESDLLKAVTCGFNDRPRMEQQPEFKQAGLNIKSIVARITK